MAAVPQIGALESEVKFEHELNVSRIGYTGNRTKGRGVVDVLSDARKIDAVKHIVHLSPKL